MRSIKRKSEALILAVLVAVSLTSVIARGQSSSGSSMAVPAQASKPAAAEKLDINTATKD
jgi:hypothetical protein